MEEVQESRKRKTATDDSESEESQYRDEEETREANG